MNETQLQHLKDSIDGLTLSEVISFDLVEKIMPLLNAGIYKINDNDKIVPTRTDYAKHFVGPWIYVGTDKEKDCSMYHKILFESCGVLPSRCMQCWKVVVQPRTIIELMALLHLQEKYYDGPCKCGIEIRDYNPKLYGGYFYNNSQDEGQQCYEKVRGLVDMYISEDMPVALKRSCTEFEMKYGPSDKWEEVLEVGFRIDKEGNRIQLATKEEQAKWESLVRNHVDLNVKAKTDTGTAPIVKLHVVNEWYKYAYKTGDPTVKQLNPPHGDFYSKAVTYHKEVVHGGNRNNSD